MSDEDQDHRSMAEDGAPSLSSPPMSALNPAVPSTAPSPDDPSSATTAGSSATRDEEVSAESLSLGRRLRQPRTIISLVLPLFLLVLLVRALPGFDLAQLPTL